MADMLPLKILWDRWATAVSTCPLVVRVSRPPLLPHLRAVDTAQELDAVESLALAGVATDSSEIRAALAASGTRAAAAGWPAALPAAEPDTGAPAGAVIGYAAALLECRLAMLELLQGGSPEAILAQHVNRWLDLIVRKEDTDSAEIVPASAWTAAEAQPSWVARGILLHLAVHRQRPARPGTGRTARLLMNTLVAAAGHDWVRIPGALRTAYDDAVARGLADGDARPFCTLLTLCADRDRQARP